MFPFVAVIAPNVAVMLPGATKEDASRLDTFGRKAGLAFQIVDDILDVEESSESLGKTAGKDEAAGKATLVSVLGVERARAQAEALATQAARHLESFGAKADLLRELAGYVVSRRN